MSAGHPTTHRGREWTRDENGEPIQLPPGERAKPIPTPHLRVLRTDADAAFERARARRNEILPDVESVIAACEGMYGLERGELRATGRSKQVARARKVAFYAAMVTLRLSQPEAGRAFGRDKASACAAFHWAQERVERKDPRLLNELAILGDVLGVALVEVTP